MLLEEVDVSGMGWKNGIGAMEHGRLVSDMEDRHGARAEVFNDF